VSSCVLSMISFICREKCSRKHKISCLVPVVTDNFHGKTASDSNLVHCLIVKDFVCSLTCHKFPCIYRE
jgi:hypothetical protein